MKNEDPIFESFDGHFVGLDASSICKIIWGGQSWFIQVRKTSAEKVLMNASLVLMGVQMTSYRAFGPGSPGCSV